METKIYVGNMSRETTELDLRTLFSEAGTVESVDVIMDRQTGQPRGFAFVTMSSEAEATKAISLFDGKDLKVRLGGACLNCPLLPSTLHGWVAGTVHQFFPGINVVEEK